MNSYTIFNIIIGILIFDFVFGQILEFLNKTCWGNDLPEELKDVFDAEEYKRSFKYKQVNYSFGIISGIFSFAVIMFMFFLKGFAFVDDIARIYSENPIVIALIFFGILMFASDILNTPFSAYSTFIIEEKFGFNKTTIKTFFLDKIKSWILGAIIGGGLLSLIIWVYEKTTDMFWIYAWILISAFMIFMAMFYSNLIVPLFNKQTPLEEGELKDAIKEFSAKVGFKLDNIFVIDGSKRSSKSNAYFTGLGAKKRIVLYDTLIKDLSTQEIVAVLAHEIGHYKKKHTLSGIVISILQTGLTLYILSLFIGNPQLSKALGVEQPSFHISIIAFGILYSPLSTIIGLALSVTSRKNEYAADRFTAENYDGIYLVKALKTLTEKNLSNLTPHPLYVFFNYSHPTLLQRIQALNKVIESKK